MPNDLYRPLLSYALWIPPDFLESMREEETFFSMTGAHLFQELSPQSCLALPHCSAQHQAAELLHVLHG